MHICSDTDIDPKSITQLSMLSTSFTFFFHFIPRMQNRSIVSTVHRGH